ncbi:hypothetical protein B566_EDAN003903 [Ephemera danica]|nr:hypothetical protein B566_EDAN003903 [Ephemera danica]
MIHTDPTSIIDGSNADIASDSYNHYLEDAQLAADLGVNFYRFSFAWSRILPSGHTDQVNPDGVAYYNNLIDALLTRGVMPMVGSNINIVSLCL